MFEILPNLLLRLGYEFLHDGFDYLVIQILFAQKALVVLSPNRKYLMKDRQEETKADHEKSPLKACLLEINAAKVELGSLVRI